MHAGRDGVQERRLKKAADGAYTALVSYSGSEEEATEIGKDSVSILYTGTGTGADCTVNATGLILASGVADECETLEELVSRINDTGNYAATFTSSLQALIDALEGVSYIGEAELAAASRVMPDTDTGYVYFAGGDLHE